MGLFRRTPPEPPLDRFLRAAREGLGQMPGVVRVEVRSEFELVGHHADGTPGPQLNLASIWRSVQDEPPKEQLRVLNRLLEAVAAPSAETWDEVAPLLRPTVKPVGWGLGQPADNAALRRPLAPFLIETIAVDAADAMGFLTPSQMDRLGAATSVEQAFELAHQNLQAEGMPVAAADGDLAGGFWVVGPDAYESAWLALPELLARVGEHTAGDPLVLAPDRSNVLVVGEDDHRLVQAALDWAGQTFREAPRPLTPAAYRPTEDGLVPWAPATDHPAAVSAARAEQILALTEYGDQTQHLQDLMDKSGDDVFVANLKAYERDDGSIWTLAVWPADVTDELAPQAEFIGFVDGDDQFLVRWDDVQRLAGSWLVAEPGWSPPRWRARGWPPADVVAELRAVATEA